MTHAHSVTRVLRKAVTGAAIVAASASQAAPSADASASAARATPAASTSLGPTVAYNEAVRVIGGKRIVQLPPPNPHNPKQFVPRLDGAYKPHAGYMIEAEAGLMQCTLPVYHQHGCEPSTYGSKRSVRTWIVLRGGQWQACIGIDQPKKCRALYPTPGSPDARERGAMPNEAS